MKQVLPIISIPDERLKKISQPLTEVEILSSAVQKLGIDMIATMYEDDGIGLAAPQIGKNIRLITIGKDALKNQTALPFSIQNDLVLFNPEITEYSWKTEVDEEGCLSVPGYAGLVARHIEITVSAQTLTGEKIIFLAKKYFARVLQHEIDHLNGILFIDRAKEVWKHKRTISI